MPTHPSRSTHKGELEAIVLPRPAFRRSKTVARALRLRRTIREVSAEPLPLQTLSDLLWAACGINRKRGPFGLTGRTAASASNSQEIDVYVVMRHGTYRYYAPRHLLMPIVAGDLRPLAIGPGQRRSGDRAPVRLLYIADIDKLAHSAGYQEPGLRDRAVQRSYYYADTGLIAANVYLFAASAGLAAWFHNCDRAGITNALDLGRHQRPLFGQTVGYPRPTRRSSGR